MKVGTYTGHLKSQIILRFTEFINNHFHTHLSTPFLPDAAQGAGYRDNIHTHSKVNKNSAVT